MFIDASASYSSIIMKNSCQVLFIPGFPSKVRLSFLLNLSICIFLACINMHNHDFKTDGPVSRCPLCILQSMSYTVNEDQLKIILLLSYCLSGVRFHVNNEKFNSFIFTSSICCHSPPSDNILFALFSRCCS